MVYIRRRGIDNSRSAVEERKEGPESGGQVGIQNQGRSWILDTRASRNHQMVTSGIQDLASAIRDPLYGLPDPRNSARIPATKGHHHVPNYRRYMTL